MKRSSANMKTFAWRLAAFAVMFGGNVLADEPARTPRESEERWPRIARADQECLERFAGEFMGRRLEYAASRNSGRAVEDAILIDAFNCIAGERAVRHLLVTRHPAAKATLVLSFRYFGRQYYEWLLEEPPKEPATIFMDVTHWHGLF